MIRTFRSIILGAMLVYCGQSAFAVTGDSTKVLDNLKFNVKTVKGEEVNFANYLGKGPVLVNFWALWCEPCKQELKAFKNIVDKLQSQGVSMVSINTDQVRSLAKVRAYVATQGITVPMLVDPDGDVARDIFSMESLPYSLILNPDGSVYRKHTGYNAGDENKIEAEVTELAASLKQGK
jgi:cytochrome c biogenesis protein CcmG/thiol:disulfide interchange protein DsbE